MIKVLAQSGNLAHLLKVTTSVGGANIVPAATAVPEVPPYPMPVQRVAATGYTLACAIPAKRITVVSGPSAKCHIRFGHTDVKVPDFTKYRRTATKYPHVKNSEAKNVERLYNGIAVGIGGAAGLYAAKTVVTTFVESMAASANVVALGKIEVNKSDIPEGKSVTFKWRGKPLFIRHRTDEEINIETKVDVKSLRDPEPDSARVKDPKWLVVIGVCTHLGCVPIANQGEFGGYFCPCHGSHYDYSGRIRKGPAPTNLVVPPYEITGDVIVVG